MSKNLMEKLSSASTSILREKERKHNVDDALALEEENKVWNRTRFGSFVISLLMSILTVSFFYIVILFGKEVCFIIRDQQQLEKSINVIYLIAKKFILDYQSIIAIVATLAFGDKIKNKS